MKSRQYHNFEYYKLMSNSPGIFSTFYLNFLRQSLIKWCCVIAFCAGNVLAMARISYG